MHAPPRLWVCDQELSTTWMFMPKTPWEDPSLSASLPLLLQMWRKGEQVRKFHVNEWPENFHFTKIFFFFKPFGKHM